MKSLSFFLFALSLNAQAPVVTADLRGGVPVDKATVQTETLHYTINWPSGLSLGEGQLTSTRTKSAAGETFTSNLTLEAAIPGFPVRESIKSEADSAYCSIDIAKDSLRGKKASKENTVFDQRKMTATRTTLNGGGKTEISTPTCAKDALAYIFFLRHELAQGRLPLGQKVFYGSAYDLGVQYMGSQKIKIGDTQLDADRLTGTIKGPASQTTVEIFFARDAVRTPLMVNVPLAMGKFSMELVR